MTTKVSCFKYQKGNNWHKRIKAWKICFSMYQALPKEHKKHIKPQKIASLKTECGQRVFLKEIEKGKPNHLAWDI